MGAISAPELLSTDHQISGFDCTKPPLNRWLFKYALKNQETKDSRTYVVHVDGRVVGYYSLATASIQRRSATRAFRHGAPDPIPAILLGQLAVDQGHAGQGVGSGLLRDAFFRAQQVSEMVGARILILDALDDDAVNFYLHRGFKRSPIDPMLLMHSLTL